MVAVISSCDGKFIWFYDSGIFMVIQTKTGPSFAYSVVHDAKAILMEVISQGNFFFSRFIYSHGQTKLRERGNTHSLMGILCCFVMQKKFVG